MALGVDSSIVIALLKGGELQQPSLEFFLEMRREARVVICDVAYAEISFFYRDELALRSDLSAFGLSYDAVHPGTAYLAGQIYKRYRQAGGTRDRLVSDFLIGAHAINQCSGLLTTDPGYLRKHFRGLKVYQPPTK